jgi:phenylacetate-coenzyme A ligase PaaK-like adenylate-forming protein
VDELEVLVGDVRLRADDVAVAARGVPGLGERFQIRVRSSDGKEKIAIAFEGEGGLKDTVLEALLRGIPALRTLESSGALAVEVVKRWAIPTIAGKTPRIVDEREG